MEGPNIVMSLTRWQEHRRGEGCKRIWEYRILIGLVSLKRDGMRKLLTMTIVKNATMLKPMGRIQSQHHTGRKHLTLTW